MAMTTKEAKAEPTATQSAAQAPAATQQPAAAKAPTVGTQIESWMGNDKMLRRLVDALSGYLDARTFAAQCVLAARDVKLADCSAVSLFEAFLVCAQMGLLPGKHHGHVALIPRNDKERGGKVVDVMPQWQGYKFLMELQDGIKRVTPVLVHVNDTFDFDGVQVVHRFDPFDEGRQFKHPSDATDPIDAGLRGGYLRIEHDDGEVRYHFVPLAKIERARSCSQVPDLDKFKNPGPWRAWYTEQATKTIVRDAWARRVVRIDPILASRFGAAVERDDLTLQNDPAEVPAAKVQQQPRALTQQAQNLAPSVGMQALRQQVGLQPSQASQATVDVPAQQVELPDAPTKPDPACVCPVCGVVDVALRGQMTAKNGCPNCNGKAPADLPFA